MLGLLLVLGLMFSRARDPHTWSWLEKVTRGDATASQAEPLATPVAEGSAAPQEDAIPASHPTNSIETTPPPADPSSSPPSDSSGSGDNVRPAAGSTRTIAGPLDQDPVEREASRVEFEVQGDGLPLVSFEMPAYWRSLRWANSDSFDNLHQRAHKDVAVTRLWEQPEKFRGELIELRLHIKRIIEWDSPENSAGVRKVYEAAGFTDESRSQPYIVVFSELPKGMTVGTNVSEEGVFVGYFLKNMSYVAVEKRRVAPLLVGRIERVAFGPPPVTANDLTWLIAAGVLAAGAIAIVMWFLMRRPKRTLHRGTEGATDEPWFSPIDASKLAAADRPIFWTPEEEKAERTLR